MSIFSKPVSQIDTADLQELLNDETVENVRLEFKSGVPERDPTLKKLSSFANTFGGYLIVGAKEGDKDNRRLREISGVDSVDGYKQQIASWCFARVSPPLVVEVSEPIPVPGATGNVCYVIYTSESDAAPHFLNGRKGVWVRADETSQRYEPELADENEIRHLLDRRKLVRERRDQLIVRAKKRFDVHVGRAHTNRSGDRTKSGSLLQFSVVPRFPARPLCQQDELKGHFRGASARIATPRLFPKDTISELVSQHESVITLNAVPGNISMIEANVWGLLFYAMRADGVHTRNNNVDSQSGPSIHLPRFVGYLLLFIRHAGDMLKTMGYSGPIRIENTISSVLRLPWLTSYEGAWFNNPGSELDDDVAFSVATTAGALLERPDGVALEILRQILFAVNLSELSTNENLETLLRSGHKVNTWPVPANLRI